MDPHATKRSRKARAADPFGAEYEAGLRRRGKLRGGGHVPDGDNCCVCGRLVRADHAWVVLNHEAAHRFPESGDKEDALSLYAVGPECLKRCPKEYVREPFPEQVELMKEERERRNAQHASLKVQRLGST